MATLFNFPKIGVTKFAIVFSFNGSVNRNGGISFLSVILNGFSFKTDKSLFSL